MQSWDIISSIYLSAPDTICIQQYAYNKYAICIQCMHTTINTTLNTTINYNNIQLICN